MEAFPGAGSRAGGLGPAEVEAVGEEFAMRSGDKSRAGSGLGFGLDDSREDRVDCGRTEPVFVYVGGTG